MSTEYMLGFALGILIVAVLFAIIFVLASRWTKTNYFGTCKYDERQELVRGKGFKYGFFAVLIYNALYGALDSVFAERLPVETMTAMFIGILVGVLVHVCYCIWNEGYIALNENPKRLKILFAFIALLNLIVFVMNVLHGEVVVDGIYQNSIINLGCTIMFLVIFIFMFAKELSDRRDND